MPKFTQEIKDKWITELRSGKYEQGNNQLVTKFSGEIANRYCCLAILGLVCNISECEMKGGLFCLTEQDNNGLRAYSDKYPELFRVAFPSDDNYTEKWKETLAGKLAVMNDDGSTFNEIADYIEQNIPAEE